MKNNFYFLLISCVTFSMVHANDVDRNVELINSEGSIVCKLMDSNGLSGTPQFTLNEGLSLTEVEHEVDLGFDPYLFLSPDFDPYFGMELNLDSLNPLEEEEVILDFDTSLYLPKNFNPYSGI
ncbi:hypothetical protein DZC72_07290 [Maribacter algicola]|uniref:Uncharacterized protein n=1 Tax=Maribacter algicola TaxID=2498892 RepID=A0A3R8R5E9_9FLAO|nr:hypothetical protein [Maribacter algicola]RRQ50348.1 hypothetical protein DZC72_07290 [Maribacter algicola]